jgi:hypothetical protein
MDNLDNPHVEETARYIRNNGGFYEIHRQRRNASVVQDWDGFGYSLSRTFLSRLGMKADDGDDENVQWFTDTNDRVKMKLTNLGALRYALAEGETRTSASDGHGGIESQLASRLITMCVANGDRAESHLDVENRGPMAKREGGGRPMYTPETVLVLYHPGLQPGADFNIFVCDPKGIKKFGACKIRQNYDGAKKRDRIVSIRKNWEI